MNRIKKLCLLSALFIAALASAQQNSDLTASALTQKMKAYIGFSDALTPKVQEINETFIAKISDAKTKADAKREKMSNVKEADSERNRSLKAIFSEEEFRKFKEFKKANREEMKEKIKDRQKLPE